MKPSTEIKCLSPKTTNRKFELRDMIPILVVLLKNMHISYESRIQDFSSDNFDIKPLHQPPWMLIKLLIPSLS